MILVHPSFAAHFIPIFFFIVASFLLIVRNRFLLYFAVLAF